MKPLAVLFLCCAALALLFGQAEPPVRDAGRPVVRTIEFANFQPIKTEQILERLKAKGIRLAVERPLDSEEVAATQAALEKLLAENGRSGARVKAEITPLPPRAVKVAFTAAGQ
jgi:outer membrane protein assembly factor BamA